MISNLLEVADQGINQRAAETLKVLKPTSVHAQALFDLLRTDAMDVDRVIRVLQRESILSARVLSVINSAAFALPRQICSIKRAVTLLGAARARSIGLAYGLKLLGESSGLPRTILDTLWSNSIVKACAAYRFCQIADLDCAEEAYGLGLIQDIGLPVLMAADKGFYEAELLGGDPSGSWSSRERFHFGLDHTEVGRLLLKSWNAPEILQQAVAVHHQPLARLPQQNETSLLHVASFLAGLLPHWHEEPVGWQRNWIDAIHARFLAEAHASPDDFMLDVIAEARKLCGRDVPADDADRQQALYELIGEVSDDMIRTVTNLWRIETALHREREELAQVRQHAFTDSLTRLLNRRGFRKLADRRLQKARTSGESILCLMFDFDDFKVINDTHGHDAGDRMLRGMAKLLRRKLRKSDLFARVGGDEFVAIIAGVEPRNAHDLAKNLVVNTLGCRVQLTNGQSMPLLFSVGAAFFPAVPEDLNLERVLAAADHAMYQRKRSGKRGLHFVVVNDQSASLDRTPTFRPDDSAAQEQDK